MAFIIKKNNIAKINTDTNAFNRFIQAISFDIMADIQSRFGKVGERTSKGGTVKANSSATQNVKGKDTPLIGRTGKGRRLSVAKKGTGTYIIGVTQSYMIKVLEGGIITAKGRGLIIPTNKEAGTLLRKYIVINGGKGEGITRLILDNEPNLFIPPGKNVMLKKTSRGQLKMMFAFKKSVTLPNRDILYFRNNNKMFIKNAIIDYMKLKRVI